MPCFRFLNGALLVLCTMQFATCRQKTPDVQAQPKFAVENINAFDSKPFHVEDYIKGIQYVSLETKEGSLFSEIDKLRIKGSRIYILDLTGLPYLYVFDLNTGKFLQRIGKRGNGPGEYMKLTDFDVSDNGTIYLYDRQKMQMLTFDRDGTLLEKKKTPFRADGFNLLDSSKYIFSVDKESSVEKCGGNKIVVTDTAFGIISAMFPYRESSHDDKASPALFTESTKGILYNKPVNDSLFLFDRDGHIVKSYFVNFGNSTVPDQLKDSYVDLSRTRAQKTYQYLYKTPMIIGDFITGNMYDGNTRSIFLYDGAEKVFYTKKLLGSDLSHLNINLPLASVGDSLIASYLDYDILYADHDRKLLDTALVSHIEQKNNGSVIALYHLKTL